MRAELSKPGRSQPQPPVPNHQTRQYSRSNSLAGSNAGSGPASPSSRFIDKTSYPLSDLDHDAREDHQAAWAMEEQQMMIREQDQTMDSIAGTLSTLAQQAGLMGQELAEHNELAFSSFTPFKH
jgi:hypothetical protein